MRIFYDTEFIERGSSFPLELVSIGMVREDGESLYLINADVSLSSLFRHPWLSINVVPHLPIVIESPMPNGIVAWDAEHVDYPRVMALDSIRTLVQEFCQPDGDLPAELWAYYGAYDHVCLCQIFGTMNDLPAGIPMFTHDLVQEWSRLGYPDGVLPLSANADKHHALADAVWAKDAYEKLMQYAEEEK